MKDKQVLISVVMPVYNGGYFLQDAIDSILSQSLTDFEFIIINDGSTDNTEEIIMSYDDPRICYVKNSENLKLIKTLNKGIDIARGKYIARMDADDISLPTRFEDQVKIFEEYIGVDIVNVRAFLLDEDAQYYRKPNTLFPFSFEASKYVIPFQNFICHPGVMIRSSVLKKYKYEDSVDSLHIEDFHLWNRLLLNGHICYNIDKYLLLYRLNGGSITHQNRRNQVQLRRQLIPENLDRITDVKISNDCLAVILRDVSSFSFRNLVKTDHFFEAYFESLFKKYSWSLQGEKDIRLWKKHFMFSNCINALRSGTFQKRIYILLFFISRINWFFDIRWLKLINPFKKRVYKLTTNSEIN